MEEEHEEGKKEEGAPAAPVEGGPVSAKSQMNYPLVKVCDMADEMRTEALECVVTAVEKHPGQYENAAKMMKEVMDKKFGPSWNAVVGEGYGFNIQHSVRNLLFLFYGGTVAVLLFKAT
ncbi:putative outer arm dynein light chain 4 [Paratrimastix pyriformis]|uniref:Dynein light chain n=1 Tax=Paratrimastix pyriformis TaxID=342808 RepID=A0ABQ8UH05_9EUKA|nr:putative outer arm dynein light chain 4 [Paratrimastix pyriformis]|eukprot:GAFH01005893.1.p1 GENE.GAFH01005893.1~~GAFH01005893.1.p1  ORF type:complete len:130 (-),score=10.28 GAFH01005893.1:189-545(-)